MQAPISKLTAPAAYWDRTFKVVRRWSTNEILPAYEGPCMVYLDTRGPVFVDTFIREGERCWESADVQSRELNPVV